jgi:cell division protein FtsI/penicillin-binding protein 2
LAPTIKVADREIGEAHDAGYRTITTAQILKESSNVGAVTIGLRLGAEDFDKWVRRFGFGTPTGIDLPGEEQGIVLDVKNYSGASMGNLPIGQGIAVTPMQMATAYAAIANGGILRPPHIVEDVGARPAAKPQGHRILSEATAASLRRMLEGVLGPGGTASGASIDGYVMAGKTGTAEKPDETGGYSKTKFVSSFVGFAPARRPKLLVAVMVDEPQGDIYGGTVAAPAFREITSFALNYLKIPPR